MWKVETSLRSIEIEEISARNEFSYVTVMGMFDESIRYVVDYPKKKLTVFRFLCQGMPRNQRPERILILSGHVLPGWQQQKRSEK